MKVFKFRDDSGHLFCSVWCRRIHHEHGLDKFIGCGLVSHRGAPPVTVCCECGRKLTP